MDCFYSHNVLDKLDFCVTRKLTIVKTSKERITRAPVRPSRKIRLRLSVFFWSDLNNGQRDLLNLITCYSPPLKRRISATERGRLPLV